MPESISVIRGGGVPVLQTVLGRLGRDAVIGEAELRSLTAATRLAERCSAGAQFHASGHRRQKVGLVMSGWGCEAGILLDGRRQIFSILLPGDFVLLPPRFGQPSRSITAITGVEMADVTRLWDAGTGPLSLAINATLAAAHDRLFDQIIRLGQMSAYERVVHLLVDLHNRVSLVGLVSQGCFRMPLTQEVMADVLGLSIVHVNRTLQQLRRDGLIEIRAGEAIMLQPGRLAAIAGVELKLDEMQPIHLTADQPVGFFSLSA